MKVFVVISAVLAVVAGKPGLLAPVAVPLAPVAVPLATAPLAAIPVSYASQYHAQDELGQYSYGYADQLSSKAEVKTADGITRGGYSYVDPEGKLQTVQYTSDAINGFRVAASNLPKAPEAPAAPVLPVPIPVQDTPEVATAKARHMEALKDAELRAAAAPAEELPKAALASVVSTYAAPAITTYSAAPAIAYSLPHTYSYATYSHLAAAPVISTYAAPLYHHYTSPLIQPLPLSNPIIPTANDKNAELKDTLNRNT